MKPHTRSSPLRKIRARAARAASFLRTGLVVPAVERALKTHARLPRAPALGAEIVPPFMSLPQHVCFGCAPRHPFGLKLRFFTAQGWALATTWEATSGYENYPGMIHGGVLTTILDELAGQAVFRELGHMPVSLDARLRWLKAAKVGMRLTAAARIASRHDGFARVETFLFREDGKVAARMSGLYFTPTLAVFRKVAELHDVSPEAAAWFAPEPATPGSP
jgi:acyl-coenzyme A thioesterase PaaI-like protein